MATMLSVRPTAGPLVLRRCAEGQRPCTPTRFRLTPVGVTIGAVVEGVDLAQPCDAELQAELAVALWEWKVLFFRDQDMTLEQQGEFAAGWGQLTDDNLVPSTSHTVVDNVVVFTRDATIAGLENEWHTDGTFRPMPTLGTMLRAIEVPAVGGDTLFADMAAAYDNVAEPVRARLGTLTAIHDWSIGA